MKAEIVRLEDGQAFLILPPEMLAALNLKEGDALVADPGPGFVKLRRPRPDEIENDD
jgi:hypothetical protein